MNNLCITSRVVPTRPQGWLWGVDDTTSSSTDLGILDRRLGMAFGHLSTIHRSYYHCSSSSGTEEQKKKGGDLCV